MRFLIAITTALLALVASAQTVYDARIDDYRGLKYACDGSVTPVLRIQNVGSATMSTCVVETWKNGVVDNTFKIIPGHGALSAKADLKGWRDMLATIRARVKKEADAGKPLEAVQKANLTAEWDQKWGSAFIKPERNESIVDIIYNHRYLRRSVGRKHSVQPDRHNRTVQFHRDG